MKKKILFFSQDINIGGSQLLLKDVVTYLLKKDYDCHIWSPFTGTLEPVFVELGAKLHILDFEVDKINRDTLIKFNKKAEKKIIKILDYCKKHNKKLAIRCAGTLTEIILNKFDFNGVNLIGIFDNASFLEGKNINGYNIYNSSELCKLSPDVVIIAHVNPKTFKEELKSNKIKKFIAPVEITRFQTFIKTVKYLLDIRKPISFIAKLNPDIVFINNARNFWVAIAAKLLFKTVIWAIHENFDPKTFRVFPTFLYLCALKLADKFVFPSKFTYEIYKNFINKETSTIIYNGINLKEIENFKQTYSIELLKKDLGINQDHKVISVIGTVYNIKGQLFFAKAAINILKSLPNDKLVFLIVGDIYNDYSKEIKSLIETSGYKENINLIPLTSEVYKYFYITDIFVNSSITESFGIAVIEAMAFNKPVIAPKTGGIPEIIDNDINGILISSKNLVTDIEKNIKYLLDNDEIRFNLANNGYKKVSERFIIEKTLENYENVIKQF